MTESVEAPAKPNAENLAKMRADIIGKIRSCDDAAAEWVMQQSIIAYKMGVRDGKLMAAEAIRGHMRALVPKNSAVERVLPDVRATMSRIARKLEE